MHKVARIALTKPLLNWGQARKALLSLNQRKFKLRELEVLRLLFSMTPEDAFDYYNWARLLAQFVHPGIKDDGDHFCLLNTFAHPEHWSWICGSHKRTNSFQFQLWSRFWGTFCWVLRIFISAGLSIPVRFVVKSLWQWLFTMQTVRRHKAAIDHWLRKDSPHTYALKRSSNKMASVYLAIAPATHTWSPFVLQL